MSKGRLEAFSDGVIAILITIMVLELKIPKGAEIQDLIPLLPVFLSYLLSFLYLGIYWNNHHHLLQAVKQVDGRVLWANMHLLFWLSLVPFATAWMGENNFSRWPVALYGLMLLMAAVAYYILTLTLIALHGRDSLLASALGQDTKGRLSILIYLAAIVIAYFWSAAAACILYAVVAVVWLVPDRRIEKKILS
jgi:uncharacterized membrane protein